MRTNAFEFMTVESKDKLAVFSSFLDNLKILSRLLLAVQYWSKLD